MHKILILIICVLFISCSSNLNKKNFNDSEKYVVDLDTTTFEEKWLYSSIFSRMRTIILENIDNALLSSISKMDICNENIVILDINAKKILVFDNDGKFLRQIGLVGNGPGEYVLPYDFTYNKDEDEIYVLDVGTNNINRYKLSSGKYISSINIKSLDSSRMRKICYLDGTLFADAYFYSESSDDDYLLQKIDLASGKQIDTFFTAGKEHNGWHNTNTVYSRTFHYTGKRTLFIQQYMKTAMLLSADTISSFIGVQSKNFVTNENTKQLKDARSSDRLFIDKVWFLDNFFEHNDNLFFTYMKKGSRKFVTFNMIDGSAKQYNVNWNDFLFNEMERVIPQFGCVTDKGFYNYIFGDDILNLGLMISDDFCSEKLDKKEELMKLNEDSNPVIFYYEFKE